MATKPKPPDKRQELLDVIAAGPPAGGSVGESFVGVPSGYGALPGVTAPPRYREGYQFTPAGWPPEMVARLQLMLDGAGLYDPDDQPRKGFFNPEVDVKAFKRLLTYANASGQDFETALVQIGSQPRRLDSAARSRARVDITSSEDLKELANRVSKKSIGKALDPTQLDTFIKAYQGLESGGAAGIPSPEAFMSSKVEQANPKETYARKLVDKFAVVDNIMTGGGLGIQAAQAGQGGGTTGI